MKKRLPRFASEREEARFWDTHDAADLLPELEEDLDVVILRPEVGLIEVRPVTWRRLVREAKRCRTTPQRLVQRWLAEKLRPTE